MCLMLAWVGCAIFGKYKFFRAPSGGELDHTHQFDVLNHHASPVAYAIVVWSVHSFNKCLIQATYPEVPNVGDSLVSCVVRRRRTELGCVKEGFCLITVENVMWGLEVFIDFLVKMCDCLFRA